MSQEKYDMSDGMIRTGNSRLIIMKAFKPVVTVPLAPKKREAKLEAFVYNTMSWKILWQDAFSQKRRNAENVL